MLLNPMLLLTTTDTFLVATAPAQFAELLHAALSSSDEDRKISGGSSWIQGQESERDAEVTCLGRIDHLWNAIVIIGWRVEASRSMTSG